MSDQSGSAGAGKEKNGDPEKLIIKFEKVEKIEQKEKPEKWEHKEKPEKIEVKEKPEKWEHKEKPEKFEHKEKPEKLEHKEKVEKFEQGEKYIIEQGGKLIAENVGDPGSIDERVATLEQSITSLQHFITGAQRPDLSRGALSAEPGAKKSGS
jgi:hypothetical protein